GGGSMASSNPIPPPPPPRASSKSPSSARQRARRSRLLTPGKGGEKGRAKRSRAPSSPHTPPLRGGAAGSAPRGTGVVERVPEEEIHRDLVREVGALAQGEGALARLHRSLLLVREIVVVGHAVHHPAQPSLITNELRQRLRLLHVIEDPGAVGERHE